MPKKPIKVGFKYWVIAQGGYFLGWIPHPRLDSKESARRGPPRRQERPSFLTGPSTLRQSALLQLKHIRNIWLLHVTNDKPVGNGISRAEKCSFPAEGRRRWLHCRVPTMLREPKPPFEELSQRSSTDGPILVSMEAVQGDMSLSAVGCPQLVGWVLHSLSEKGVCDLLGGESSARICTIIWSDSDHAFRARLVVMGPWIWIGPPC